MVVVLGKVLEIMNSSMSLEPSLEKQLKKYNLVLCCLDFLASSYCRNNATK